MPLLLAFLKMLGTAAAKGAVGLGKAALTGAKAGAKGIGTLAKAGLEKTQAGQLLNAFAAAGGNGNSPQELKGTAFDPEKYGIDNVQQGQGILPFDPNSTQEQSQVLNPLRNIVVPGPGGRPIQGQGEVMPGYEMQPPQYRIPPAYLQMAQPQQQLQQPMQPTGKYPGFLAGIKEGLLGMPSTASEPQPSEQGRQTAYYAGKLIPDIIRSRMGVSTTREEARQQGLMDKREKVMIPKSIWEQSGLSKLARNTILGTLQAGYYLHPLTGQKLPVRTKEQARDYILQKGYMDYQGDPEITSLVNNLPSGTEQPQRKGWLLGGRQPTQPKQTTQTPSMNLSGAEKRFNQLTSQGYLEDEAYRQLATEGF